MMDNILPPWLKQRAYLTPKRIALISEDETLTFAQLDRKARHMALRLISLGVKPGTHVAILLANRAQTVVFIHALMYAQGVLIPLNTRLSVKELAWQVGDAQASLVIYDDDNQEKIEALKGQVSCPLIHLAQLEKQEEAPVNSEIFHRPVSLNDLHTIIYTSGTTGRPKGAMLSYGNHFWSAVGSALNMGLTKDDRWLCALPLFHVSGLSILMRSVIYGITMVLLSRFDPEKACRWMNEHKITHISVVSTMLSALVEHLPENDHPPHLRAILLGGGPCPEPLLEKCLDRFLPVYQSYGLTETASQIVTLAPEDVVIKAGSAGKPLFPAQVRIIQQGHGAEPGQVGEIAVSGPNVTRGYYRREEETAKVLKDGWFYTGDLGYLDEDGYLYVLDRRNDLIISGGENIYPAEVESVLLAHPLIKEAGVVGKADDVWGEVPVAFVVPEKGAHLSEEEIIAFCQDKLARYKIPTKIHFVPHLPRNATNKLLRRELRQWLEKGLPSLG